MLQSVTLFGATLAPYDLLNTLGDLGMFVWVILTLKKYKSFSTLPHIAEKRFSGIRSSLVRRYLFALIEAAFIFLTLLGAAKVVTPLISQLFLGDSSANYFYNIFVLPVGVFLLGALLKVSPLKLVDYTAPMNAMVLIFYKLACSCQGCCYGVESAHGLFNAENGRYEVPVQLIETGCAVVMFIILLVLSRKGLKKPGLLYPLFMLMYCGSRFVSEFWRGDYEPICGPLKSYHIQCIIGFAEGLVFLFVVLKWGERITAFFENKNAAFLEAYEKKLKSRRDAKKTAQRKQSNKRKYKKK